MSDQDRINELRTAMTDGLIAAGAKHPSVSVNAIASGHRAMAVFYIAGLPRYAIKTIGRDVAAHVVQDWAREHGIKGVK